MQPPGLRVREHERAAVDGRPREPAEARHRRHALAPFAAGDRVVDDPLVARCTPHQGEIALLHATGFERPPECRRGLARAREEQRAARAAVEAVHGMHVRAEHVSHSEERDVVVVGPSAMDEQARRLVRDDDGLVDEEELYRRRSSQTRAGDLSANCVEAQARGG